MDDIAVDDLIRRLELAPHPEGGFYRETHREPAPEGGRALSSTILFLLPDGDRSRWHRVDATEIWFWHGGAPLDLAIGAEHRLVLGPHLGAGEVAQAIVPAGEWQAASATRGWALVSCVVSPGFDFAGFELAPDGWTPWEAE